MPMLKKKEKHRFKRSLVAYKHSGVSPVLFCYLEIFSQSLLVSTRKGKGVCVDNSKKLRIEVQL